VNLPLCPDRGRVLLAGQRKPPWQLPPCATWFDNKKAGNKKVMEKNLQNFCHRRVECELQDLVNINILASKS